MSPDPEVTTALTTLTREESGRVLALLARHFGDLDLADEAVQDALVEAATSWPIRGVPDNPPGWLLTVARRKAVDRIRRTSSALRRDLASAADMAEASEPAAPRGLIEEDLMEVGDEQLRLVLLCCHPALNRDAQTALTLRLVGGLTTAEIASAYLVHEATVTQRIVRAKRKIRAANIGLRVPDQLDERLEVVLAVLYLIYNEGYLSRGGDGLRLDLADEAIRLARLVVRLVPDEPEPAALLALLLFGRGRFATRFDATGDLVLLEDQDRTRWDGAMIAEANGILAAALRRGRPGSYQLQAVVAAQHANARTFADTDWPAIVSAYAALLGLNDSPVIRLNHAAAVSRADGPQAGLRLLDDITGLDDYHLLHATRGELLLRAGDHAGAATAYERALDLAPSPTERRHLERRLAAARATMAT